MNTHLAILFAAVGVLVGAALLFLWPVAGVVWFAAAAVLVLGPAALVLAALPLAVVLVPAGAVTLAMVRVRGRSRRQ